MPSYEKNKKSGLWSCRFREIGDDGLPHQRRLSDHFKTKKEAQFAYEDYIKQRDELKKQQQAAQQEAQKAAQKDPNELLFDDLLSMYLEFQKPRIKESSLYDVRMKAKCRILPFFTGMRMKDIKPSTVLDWLNSLSEYSYKYRAGLMTHLSSIYSFGEKYHEITNIMSKVDRPRNLEGKKEMLFWTPEEFERFVEKVKNTEYNMLYRTLYLTGCRRGEALALTWDDIDEENGTINISKSVGFKVRHEGKNYKVTPPKNVGSNRNIVIPSFFMEQLREYKDWQKENKESQDFVFGGSAPLPPTTIERIMTKATDAAGVKRIRVHDFRHSCASLLLSKGNTIISVSKHLGHNSVEQTLDTYAHMMPDDRTMLKNTLEGLGTLLGTKK